MSKNDTEANHNSSIAEDADARETGRLTKKEKAEINRALNLFMQLGFSMAACVIIGFFLGRFLDKYFGTSPWMLLMCCLLGAAASLKLIIDLAAKEREKGDKSDNVN